MPGSTTLSMREYEEAKKFFDRGNARFDSGDYKAAIWNFDETIGINPDFEEAYAARKKAKAKLKDSRRH